MRIILFSIIILTNLIGIRPIHAQIKTYDIKTGRGTGYEYLQQISPTRTLAMTADEKSSRVIVAFNGEGIIERQWKSTFGTGHSDFYRYDSQSNTLVFLADEKQQHLVLLDSNLIEKSNIILDSTVTGLPIVFKDIRFRGISLRDSTILWMSCSMVEKLKKQIVLHISKDGRIINRNSIVDTNESPLVRTHYPLFQMESGNIIFSSLTSNPKIQYSTVSSFRISDTNFQFAPKPIVDSLVLANNITYLPTHDDGLALLYYTNTPIRDKAALVKYDKNFQKQWTTYLPVSNRGEGCIVESRKGGYYIATDGYDTPEAQNHPQYPISCFQDLVLSRVDTSGNVLFSTYYGSDLCNEYPYSVIEDNDGGIVVSGLCNSSAGGLLYDCLCRDPLSGWLFKVDSLGEPAKRKVITGVAEKGGKASEIRLFPNPASGVLTVEFGRTGYFTSIEIVDMNGRLFQTSLVEATADRTNVDISALSSGSYFCRVRAGANFIARPFVIQR
jgi:hypothetical protein